LGELGQHQVEVGSGAKGTPNWSNDVDEEKKLGI